MKKYLIFVFIFMIGQFAIAQCPDGPTPTFWHPDQIDSFQVLYPNCNDFNFVTTMIDGEYVQPNTGTLKHRIFYILSLILILGLILGLLKLVTNKIEFFK